MKDEWNANEGRGKVVAREGEDGGDKGRKGWKVRVSKVRGRRDGGSGNEKD